MPQEYSRLTRLWAALAGLVVLAGCGGGGGNGGNPGGIGNNPPPPSGPTVTVSGRVTFDRLPFQTTVGNGLNATAPVVSPAREVVVQAVAGSSTLSTTTDSNGNYSISVPANSNVIMRVRAQMLKEGSAPTWNFTVKNNTNSDAVYVLEGVSFATGSENVTRDLHAASGWTGTNYTETRAAAPFAILDSVYLAKQLILQQGVAPNAVFPPLDLFWSSQNRTAGGEGGIPCPDTGNIVTSFYFSDPNNQTNDGCDPARPLPTGIYILGDYASGAGDTDEFDPHVIAHEFGHYFEDRFSRSDSIGGEHGGGNRLDPRVAFGEGWGNAFGAMALNDPQYRDSDNGISDDFGFNLESDSNNNEGWFSEASVGEILWDIFDSNSPLELGDNVALGFGPIYAVMNDEQVDTDAFTSIYSFADALQSNNAGSSAAIDNLLDAENIEGNDEFGTNETNDGGVIDTVPVYQTLALNGQVYVCTVLTPENDSDLNKLGNVRFLRFDNDSARPVVLTVTGFANNAAHDGAADPDVFVYRQGQGVVSGTSGGPNVPPAQRRIETVSTTLAAGTYVLEVFDFELADASTRPRCMTVSISGN